MDNERGYAEAYKDVVHEDTGKVGSGTKAPDYGFRIGGARESSSRPRSPRVNIKGEPHPASGSRRYAWSAKLPPSILTDFEELEAYDCRTRPDKTDKSSTAVCLRHLRPVHRALGRDGRVFSREAILRARSTNTPRPRAAGHSRGGCGLSGRDRALARRAGAHPVPCATQALAKESQFRGSADHRPRHFSAYLRGPGDQALRFTAAYLGRWAREVGYRPQSPALQTAHGESAAEPSLSATHVLRPASTAWTCDPQAVGGDQAVAPAQSAGGRGRADYQPTAGTVSGTPCLTWAVTSRCGDSLIGPDFTTGSSWCCWMTRLRCAINVFNWQAEFHT